MSNIDPSIASLANTITRGGNGKTSVPTRKSQTSRKAKRGHASKKAKKATQKDDQGDFSVAPESAKVRLDQINGESAGNASLTTMKIPRQAQQSPNSEAEPLEEDNSENGPGNLNVVPGNAEVSRT